jgi:hypothetical protein
MSSDALSQRQSMPASLTRVQGHPHLRGLGGLTLAEFLRWFPLRVLVFAAGGIAVLVMARVMWSAEENAKLAPLLYIFFTLWIALLVLSTVATTQGAVSSEIEEGTAAWLVAKPIGRPAFVLSKFAGAIPAVLIGMVGIPGAVARVVLQQAADKGDTDFSAAQVLELIANRSDRGEYMRLPGMPRYLGLLALIAALTLLVVAVMILLGCVVRVQTAVLGLGVAVPVGLLLVGQLAPAAIVELTPGWVLASIVDILRDDPAPVLGPIVVTVAWICASLAGAMWLFSRREL